MACRPLSSVRTRSTRALVSSSTAPEATAGRTQQTSASALARTRHGKPSQVAHRMQLPPWRRSRPERNGRGGVSELRKTFRGTLDVGLVPDAGERIGRLADEGRIVGFTVHSIHAFGGAVERGESS